MLADITSCWPKKLISWVKTYNRIAEFALILTK